MRKHALSLFCFVVAELAAPLCFAVEFRRATPSLSDVHAATCRVRVSNARGTGIFNGYDEATGKAYISTNDHVTSVNRACLLDFWTNSRLETVKGTVIFKSRNDQTGRDFAIIEVDANDLKKIDPPYIPMKAIDASELMGRAFLSSGCPDGRFDQGWRGTIETMEGGMLIFSPPPVPGQSGSGICVEDNGRLYDVAKLTYLLGTKGQDESKGGALPLANLLRRGTFTAGASARYDRLPVAQVVEPRIIAFTSENCPACLAAEAGLLRAENADKIAIERVDALTEDGAKIAASYNVKEIPTYVVVDEANLELTRATFADIERLGSYEAIGNAMTRAKAMCRPGTQVEPPAASAAEPGKKYKLGDENGVVVSAPGEIEKTIAVYITDPASYDFNSERVSSTIPPAGLLDNLTEREEPARPTPILPRIAPRAPEPPQDEDDRAGAIGTRALDALAGRIEKRIDAGVDRATSRAESALKAAGEEIGARVEQSAGERIKAAWRGLRWKFAAALFSLITLGAIAARLIEAWAMRRMERLRAIARAIKTAEQENEKK